MSAIQSMTVTERNYNSFLKQYVPVGTVITTRDDGATVFYFPDGTIKQLDKPAPAMYSIASSAPVLLPTPPDEDYNSSIYTFYQTYEKDLLVALTRAGSTLVASYRHCVFHNVYVATTRKSTIFDDNGDPSYTIIIPIKDTIEIARMKAVVGIQYVAHQLVVSYREVPVFDEIARAPVIDAVFSLSDYNLISEIYLNPAATIMSKRVCKTGLIGWVDDGPVPYPAEKILTQPARKAVTNIDMEADGLKKTVVDETLKGDSNSTTTTVIGVTSG